jgi:hypothetical protein
MRLDIARNALIFLMVMLAGAEARAQTNARLSVKALPVVTQTAPPADFGGGISPAYRTIVPGATTTYEITVFPINGFGADVTFIGVDGLPDGSTATFNPSVIAGGSGSSTLSISTAGGTPTATYRLVVKAQGGGITHTDGVNLNVGPPNKDFGDFGGWISPAYRTIVPGATTAYEITVFPINGFSADVTFIGVDGLPEEAKATFNPSVVAGGSGTSTLTVSTSSETRTKSYRLIIKDEGGGVTHTDGVNLNVGPAGKDFGDFGGSVSPAYQTIVPGASTTFEINVFPLNGFSSDVSLSDIDGLPEGATATFNPSVIAGGSGMSTLSISTGGATPTATYHLTFVGKGGERTHKNGMGLNVGPEGTDFTDYAGSITPRSRTVGLGESTTFTLMIEPIFGTGCVYLQASGLPAATGGHFDRTTGICGTPATTVYTITTSPQTSPGTYKLTFQGTTSAGITHSRDVTLKVESCGSNRRTASRLESRLDGDGDGCNE